ncbi:MAG: ribosome-associated translation inhibitor RaiA [Patescibacteria group bacterium]|nr:ribosome-associated translation inhibitor RaiA [Patescibacteria group bacterium]
MNINFKGTRTKLTEADQSYIEDKLLSLGKFIKNADKVFIEAETDAKHKSGLVFRLEISVNPPEFYAEARGNDFYEALDLVLPKIKEQLAKQKDKKVSLRRRKTPLKELR